MSEFLASSRSFSYPLSTPVNKHDLLYFGDNNNIKEDDNSLLLLQELSNVEEMIEVLQQPQHHPHDPTLNQNNGTIITPQPISIATVYSYKDAPTHPGPLSRSLVIVGTVQRSWKAIQSILSIATNNHNHHCHSNNDNLTMVQCCTLAVPLGDTIEHYQKLSPKHQVNSKKFATLITQLQHSNHVALIQQDKYQRIGILVPILINQPKQEEQLKATNHRQQQQQSSFDVTAFYVQVYIGKIQDVVPHLVSYQGNDKEKESNDHDHMDTFNNNNSVVLKPDNDMPCEKDSSGDVGVVNGSSGGGGGDHHHRRRRGSPEIVQETIVTAMPWETVTTANSASALPWETTTSTTPSSALPWETTTSTAHATPSSALPWETTTATALPWESSTSTPSSSALPWETTTAAALPWETTNSSRDADNHNKRSFDQIMNKKYDDAYDSQQQQLQKVAEEEEDTTTTKEQRDGLSLFHKNKGAADADAFYSNLKRDLDTRADSYLYHMRAFNGWVKATQIAELDPHTTTITETTGNKKKTKKAKHNTTTMNQHGKGPLWVLDLACGKGGDLIKWSMHPRGMSHYVGIDVARGSLKDAALRARAMRKQKRKKHPKNNFSSSSSSSPLSSSSSSSSYPTIILSCADLGSDVPGRRKNYPEITTSTSKQQRPLQSLYTWKLQEEDMYEENEPVFRLERGGGISETDTFDVVSIQFAIHYMMQTETRARRFFHTVSQLLKIGGLLAFTTIDARVVIQHMMDLGINWHNVDTINETVVVTAGSGACQLKFPPDTVRKLFQQIPQENEEEEEEKSNNSNVHDWFGLEYTFTLVEGSDHAAGVGDAVNLPEWLIPIPVLVQLGQEAGLELEYAQNFHEFYNTRKDPTINKEHVSAHLALYNMKVVNRNGTISKDEWSVSRLYAAMRFRKVQESSIVIMEEEGNDDEEEELIQTTGVQVETGVTQGLTNTSPSTREAAPATAVAATILPKVVPQLDHIKETKSYSDKKMYPIAMMKAKREAGLQWNSFSREEKEALTQHQLQVIMAESTSSS